MPAWTRRLFSAVAAMAAVAGASLLTAAPSLAASCPNEPLSQPFASYGDSADYFLVPGGTFLNGGQGWTLTGGAQVIADPLSPTGYAVQIPSGGSVTTPPFCVTAHDPAMRTFGYTRVNPSQHGPTMGVALVEPDGTLQGTGRVPSQTSWAPTRKLSLRSGSTPYTNGTAMVEYQFTALNGATWELDDIYADPRMLKK